MDRVKERVAKQRSRIAILGWGSLLWDERPEFDETHDDWQPGGPILPLEFSRVSESRKRALTLVIDSENGTYCRVAYAMSKRRCPEHAIADLRRREDTDMKRMGFWFADGSSRCDPDVPDAVVLWAKNKRLDVVVWTGLCSNFVKEVRKDFTVKTAIEHLQGLSPEGKSLAATYVWRAPSFIRTRLRLALETEPWFAVDNLRI